MEKPRKDFWEMAIHHIVTIALIIGSYWMNLVRVGHAILCCMDISDIILSVCFYICKKVAQRICRLPNVSFTRDIDEQAMLDSPYSFYLGSCFGFISSALWSIPLRLNRILY